MWLKMTDIVILLGIFFIYFSYKYAWWLPEVENKHPRILMYHQIAEPIKNAKFNGLRVTPDAFEQQLKWLHNNGWNFVTMNELLENRDRIQPKTVAITFDDGYENNYKLALPLLKKYHAKATIYVVIDRHDNDWSTKKKSHHNSGELVKDKKLSDEQIVEMIQSGSIEIASHTLSHANLSQLDIANKTLEIGSSKKQLEDQFNISISSFAYPFGIYDKNDVEIAQNCEYQSAVTTENGINTDFKSPLELKRIKISGKDRFFVFKLKMKLGKKGVIK